MSYDVNERQHIHTNYVYAKHEYELLLALFSVIPLAIFLFDV